MEQGGNDSTTAIDTIDTTETTVSKTIVARFLRTPTLVRLQISIPLKFHRIAHQSSSQSNQDNMDQMHQRLAYHINNEQVAWDEILRSMDAYIQRLTVATTAKEPCAEYKVLEKWGMQFNSEYRSKNFLK